MHGYDLMAEMRKNPGLATIPVIVLTSRPERSIVKRPWKWGRRIIS